MNPLPKTTVINERHDYTGATLAICVSILAAGYFILKHFAVDPTPRETARIESRSDAIDAYHLERTRLVQLQSEIIGLRKRYDALDPRRMVELRNEVARELHAKFRIYKIEYEGSYLPLERRVSELSNH